MKKLLTALLVAGLVGCSGSSESEKPVKIEKEITEEKAVTGGIAITIDDGVSLPFLIENLDIFDRYDAKATFYMSHYNESMNDDLLMLQRNGFEIGHHSRYHKNAVTESSKVGVEKWLESEVLNPLSRMVGSGIDVQTFAYPFGHYTEETNEALKPYFSHVRGFTITNTGDYSEGFNYENYFYMGVSVDTKWLDRVMLMNAMDRASTTSETLILAIHVISENWQNNFKITPADLEFIVKYASEIGLEFKLMREL